MDNTRSTFLSNNLRLWLWLPLLLCAAALALWSNVPYDVDDAPITYRYAEQLAAGHGFTYNDGEYILGTSTPLYTLILAGARLIGMPIPLASNGLNWVSTVAVVWVTMALTAELSGSAVAGALAALYLLLQGEFIRFAMSGMETPLYTLLIMATFLAVVQGKSHWAAVLAGLAFVMRLDGLAVGGALLLGLWLQQRRLPITATLLYLCTLLPWVLFAFWYFGSPLPLSMIAKQQHLQSAGSSRYWIWDHLFITALGAPTFLLPLALPGLLVLYRQKQRRLSWFIPILWLLAYLVAYTLVGIDFYEWYLVPVYPVLALFVGAGMHLVLQAIANFWASPHRQPVPWVIAVVVLILWLKPYQEYMVLSVTGYKDYLQAVEHSRSQAGEWLRIYAPSDSKVFAGAIGHVGYQSGLYIIDGAGLVTPFERIAQLQPDYMMLDGYVPANRACGALRNFDTSTDTLLWPHTVVSGCHIAPVGNFAYLTLSNVRITNWVQTPDGSWQRQPFFYLESQWLIDQPQPNAQWTFFVHFTDVEGNTLFQADHELGLQSDRMVLDPTRWDPAKRSYVYAEMPEAWEQDRARVAAIRVGLWNPTTQEQLPITPGRSALDESGRLVIPIQTIEGAVDDKQQ